MIMIMISKQIISK